MIELSNVSKAFGGRQVLSEVCLKVEAGESIIISGPSGVGKSTILEIIAGIKAPDSGTRKLGSRRIGYTFQDDVLVPWKTARDNLVFALMSYWDKSEANRRAQEWLEIFALGDAGELYPLELSGGMRRRLGLARCFSIEPEVLLLDEPFAFQDEKLSRTIAEHVLRCRDSSQSAVVIVDHEARAEQFCGGAVVALTEQPVKLCFPPVGT